MRKVHVVAVALLLGLAAVFGVLAASLTAGIGAAARSHTRTTSVTARERQLAQVELALRRALRDRPPALPSLQAAPRNVATVAPRVVYRRPAPIVVIKHAAHHDDSTDREAQGGGGND
jgi:hypothetical protein